jgi:hypothetical protein
MSGGPIFLWNRDVSILEAERTCRVLDKKLYSSLKGIPDVNDFRLSLVALNDADHVKTAGHRSRNRPNRQIIGCHADYLALLAGINRFKRMPEKDVFFGANLDKYQGFAVTGNDIDFPVFRPEVFLEHQKTLLFKILSGKFLALAA